MAKKLRLGPVFVALAVFVFAAILALSGRPDDARFRGKSVRAWALEASTGDTNAAAALKAMGTNAVPGLAKLLKQKDSWARQRLWSAIEKLPGPLSRRLRSWTRPSQAPVYRRAAAQGLSLLQADAASAVDELITALRDTNVEVRYAAANALARIGAPAVSRLTLALADPDPVARNCASYALGQMGAAAEPALPALIDAFTETNLDARSASVYSAAVIGVPSMLAISNVLAHGEPAAQSAAITELVRVQRSLYSTVPSLLAMAKSGNQSSRRQAIAALGSLRIGSDASLSALTNALSAPEPEIRLAAVKSLKMIPWRAHEAIPELIGCLRDETPEVRDWAARTLGELGPWAASAIPELRRVAGTDAAAAVSISNVIRRIENRPAVSE